MEPKKDRKDDIPEKEWLTKEGHMLHKAEQKVEVYLAKRKLLRNALSWLLVGLVLAGLFYLLNRR